MSWARSLNCFIQGERHGKGVGLGLPLCRKLMNNTGGTINIESSRDRGTKVSLMFTDREVSNG